MALSSTEYQNIFQNFKVARSCEAYISNDGWNRFWQSILWILIWWIHNSSRLSLVWWCRYTKLFTRSTTIMMPCQGDVITALLCRESPSPTTTTHTQRASKADLWNFLQCQPHQTVEWTVKLSVPRPKADVTCTYDSFIFQFPTNEDRLMGAQCWFSPIFGPQT